MADYLQLLAVIFGILSLFTLWRARKRSQREFPAVDFKTTSLPEGESWRWPRPTVEMGFSIIDSDQESSVQLKPTWRMEHYLLLLGVAVCAGLILMVLGSVLFHPDRWIIGLVAGGISAFIGWLMMGVEPQITAVSRQPGGLKLEVTYLIVWKRVFHFARGSGWQAEGKPQSILTTTITQESISWIIVLEKKGLLISKKYRWMVQGTDREISWILGGMKESLRGEAGEALKPQVD